MSTRERPADEALSCLSTLAESSGELHRRVSQLSQWANAVGQEPLGLSYGQILPLEKRLAMVEQISESIRTLARDGNRFRRMEACALYAEGLTMAQLAAVFGVSRQRVSALLRDVRDEFPADEHAPGLDQHPSDHTAGPPLTDGRGPSAGRLDHDPHGSAAQLSG